MRRIKGIDTCGLHLLPLVVAFVAIVSLGLVTTGCEQEVREKVTGHNNPETDPTMLTRDIETLISDSGIMRYRITAPLWLVFDEAKVPRWTFPEGLKLDKYDDYFSREATVECDSATYLREEQLWRLDGRVRISNAAKERFETEQLFWDQRNRKVYSDSFIHIEKTDRVLEGYGFISNERFTTYTIRKVSGIFPVDELKKAATEAQPPAPDDDENAPLPWERDEENASQQ